MTIQVKQKGRVVIITLDRPQARNALSNELTYNLIYTLEVFDRDPSVGCFLITGSEHFFCAGADIKEMYQLNAQDMQERDYFSAWEKFTRLRTPKIAAVQGYAYGGGCELAMMCDVIYAEEDARFALPEITLGVIPGIGGTQRLTHAVGKAKAMDMILTGREISANEAEQCGLVARVFPQQDFYQTCLNIASNIAAQSKPATTSACEAVKRSFETSLTEGILFERRIFHSLFNTDGQKNGMKAFIEKKNPGQTIC